MTPGEARGPVESSRTLTKRNRAAGSLRFAVTIAVMALCISANPVIASTDPESGTRTVAPAQPLQGVQLSIQSPGGDPLFGGSFPVATILLVSVLSLAPGILLLLTAYLRISIVLDFVKRAIGLQAAPPNQVIAGLSLILTLFVMWPTFQEMHEKAYLPYSRGSIDSQEALAEAERPLRRFMYRQMRENPDSIRLFMAMRGLPKPATLADVPTSVLMPAFVLNELTIAFRIGLLVLLPFLVTDMVAASVLAAMGLHLVPPAVVALPLKLAVFVLVDGWELLVRQLVRSFS